MGGKYANEKSDFDTWSVVCVASHTDVLLITYRGIRDKLYVCSESNLDAVNEVIHKEVIEKVPLYIFIPQYVTLKTYNLPTYVL